MDAIGDQQLDRHNWGAAAEMDAFGERQLERTHTVLSSDEKLGVGLGTRLASLYRELPSVHQIAHVGK